MVNTRNDAYGTLRDYQELRACDAARFSATGKGRRHLSFENLVDGTSRFLAIGGYMWSNPPREVELRLLHDGKPVASARVETGAAWRRVGLVTEARGPIDRF